MPNKTGRLSAGRAKGHHVKFDYEDLSPDQFEKLVIAICQFLLGVGVQGFATGPDGGRDAKFVGTAELFPSTTGPWIGTTIVQAKHTNGYNKTFSDSEFCSKGTSHTVLGAEIPRIRELRRKNGLDHYLLFSNRKLTANAESKLRTLIAADCGIPESSICLCGVEQIELWLKRFPDAARIANIDPIDSPLIVSPDDLADVVEHLADQLRNQPLPPDVPTDRVSYETKNALNNMTPSYAKALRQRFLKDTQQIRVFLADPANAPLLARYESAAEEFNLQIVAKRKDHQAFDDIINYLISLLLDRDPILRAHKRLTRTVVFYMYWNCDIGLNDDSASQ